VAGARTQAQELGHRCVGTEHLLLAMLGEQDSTAALLRDAGLSAATVRAGIVRAVGTPGGLLSDAEAAALESIGIDIHAVRARIEESFGPGVLEEPAAVGRRWRLSLSRRSKKVLELSLREAVRLKQNWIGSEHILLGLLREGSGPRGEGHGRRRCRPGRPAPRHRTVPARCRLSSAAGTEARRGVGRWALGRETGMRNPERWKRSQGPIRAEWASFASPD
jgi:Clp amino terminal domain, pathogenicity island component